jgi:hypothetical protein
MKESRVYKALNRLSIALTRKDGIYWTVVWDDTINNWCITKRFNP